MVDVIPKASGNGEIVFTYRQLMAWITLVSLVSAVIGAFINQASALEQVKYRVTQIENKCNDERYIPRMELNARLDAINQKLDMIDRKVERILSEK